MALYVKAIFRESWNRLLPAELRQDPNALRLANRVLAFTLSMLFWVPVFAIIFHALGAWVSVRVVVAGGSVLIATVLPLLRRGKSPALCGNILAGLAWSTYTGLAFANGGILAPVMMWYVTIPFLSLWLCGTRSGLFWTGASLLLISGLALADYLGWQAPNELTPAAFHFLRYAGLVGIIGCVFILVLTFKQLDSLHDALARAESAGRSKSIFLANMSHEIRTPMNAVLGFVQLMQRDPALTPKQAEQLDVINRSGEHLLALINDILELSKIEAGRLTLNPCGFDLHKLLDDLDRMFRVQTAARFLSMSLEIDPAVPRSVTADQGKLRQILINLLGNAVKFTRRGGIIVRVQVAEQAPDRLVFTVEDTGLGIAADELDRVFNQFEQTSSGRHVQGGTGLGLAISRRYARLMGGDVTVTSGRGSGSVFRLEVQVEPGQSAVAERFVNRQICGFQLPAERPRVLIVDDVPENRMLLANLLESLGFALREAGNGREAIEQYVAWQPGLILMDLTMPEMDGYQAIAAIRQLPGAARTRIVVVTASAFDVRRQDLLDLGADGFLRKPFQQQDLFLELQQQLQLEPVHVAEVAAVQRDAPAAIELSAVPASMIAQMHEATLCADLERLGELLDELGSFDAEVASELRVLANRYEYETLSQLFTSATDSA